MENFQSPSDAPSRTAPTRVVHHGDGVAWLAAATLPADHAIVTSLPDVSEVPLDINAWQTWFVDTVALCCREIADDAVAVFFQTDIKRDGRWIDKGYLVQRGAAVMVGSDDLGRLEGEVLRLLGDDATRDRMAASMRALARPDAAERLATLMQEIAA